ncbi:MAG: hypothetical protein ACKV19_04780 [Verrucomicrobiales bacterium]
MTDRFHPAPTAYAPWRSRPTSCVNRSPNLRSQWLPLFPCQASKAAPDRGRPIQNPTASPAFPWPAREQSQRRQRRHQQRPAAPALTAAAHALVDHDPEAAVALLQSLDHRSSLGDRTTRATTPGQPSPEALSSGQISELLEELIDYPRFESLPRVMIELAEHRPEAVVEATLRLEETPERAHLIESIFTTWAGSDAAALSEWVIAQPESAVRHEATTTLVSALSDGSDPDFPAAVRWAATVPEEDLLKRTLMRWEAQDPEAPARAPPTLGLPADRVSGLLEFLRLNAQPDSSDPTSDP